MKNFLLLTLTLAFYSSTFAQYRVRFVAYDMSLVRQDSILISGTFNNWDQANNPKYFLHSEGPDKESIELVLSPGRYEYKYTRGSWLSAEKGVNGTEVPNRVIMVNRDTMVTDTILEWRDMFLGNQKLKLTAAVDDTTRFSIISRIASHYAFNSDYYQLDSALYYIQYGLQIFDKIKANPYPVSRRDLARQTLLLNEIELVRLALQNKAEKEQFEARLRTYRTILIITGLVSLVVIIYLYRRQR